jgi:hypothetical protein
MGQDQLRRARYDHFLFSADMASWTLWTYNSGCFTIILFVHRLEKLVRFRLLILFTSEQDIRSTRQCPRFRGSRHYMQERNFMHSCSFSCDAEEKAQNSCSGCSRDETMFGITSDEDLDQGQLDKEPFDSRIITMTRKGGLARSKCIWKTGNQLSHE